MLALSVLYLLLIPQYSTASSECSDADKTIYELECPPVKQFRSLAFSTSDSCSVPRDDLTNFTNCYLTNPVCKGGEFLDTDFTCKKCSKGYYQDKNNFHITYWPNDIDSISTNKGVLSHGILTSDRNCDNEALVKFKKDEVEFSFSPRSDCAVRLSFFQTVNQEGGNLTLVFSDLSNDLSVVVTAKVDMCDGEEYSDEIIQSPIMSLFGSNRHHWPRFKTRIPAGHSHVTITVSRRSRSPKPHSASEPLRFVLRELSLKNVLNSPMCTACKPGTFSDDEGSTSCVSCPPQERSERQFASTKCVKCDANQYTRNRYECVDAPPCQEVDAITTVSGCDAPASGGLRKALVSTHWREPKFCDDTLPNSYQLPPKTSDHCPECNRGLFWAPSDGGTAHCGACPGASDLHAENSCDSCPSGTAALPGIFVDDFAPETMWQWRRHDNETISWQCGRQDSSNPDSGCQFEKVTNSAEGKSWLSLVGASSSHIMQLFVDFQRFYDPRQPSYVEIEYSMTVGTRLRVTHEVMDAWLFEKSKATDLSDWANIFSEEDDTDSSGWKPAFSSDVGDVEMTLFQDASLKEKSIKKRVRMSVDPWKGIGDHKNVPYKRHVIVLEVSSVSDNEGSRSRENLGFSLHRLSVTNTIPGVTLSCDKCLRGDKTVGTCMASCPRGTYLNAEQNRCTECPEHHVSRDDQGVVLDTSNVSEAFSQTARCRRCPHGMTNDPDHLICVSDCRLTVRVSSDGEVLFIGTPPDFAEWKVTLSQAEEQRKNGGLNVTSSLNDRAVKVLDHTMDVILGTDESDDDSSTGPPFYDFEYNFEDLFKTDSGAERRLVYASDLQWRIGGSGSVRSSQQLRNMVEFGSFCGRPKSVPQTVGSDLKPINETSTSDKRRQCREAYACDFSSSMRDKRVATELYRISAVRSVSRVVPTIRLDFLSSDVYCSRPNDESDDNEMYELPMKTSLLLGCAGGDASADSNRWMASAALASDRVVKSHPMDASDAAVDRQKADKTSSTAALPWLPLSELSSSTKCELKFAFVGVNTTCPECDVATHFHYVYDGGCDSSGYQRRRKVYLDPPCTLSALNRIDPTVDWTKVEFDMVPCGAGAYKRQIAVILLAAAVALFVATCCVCCVISHYRRKHRKLVYKYQRLAMSESKSGDGTGEYNAAGLPNVESCALSDDEADTSTEQVTVIDDDEEDVMFAKRNGRQMRIDERLAFDDADNDLRDASAPSLSMKMRNLKAKVTRRGGKGSSNRAGMRTYELEDEQSLMT